MSFKRETPWDIKLHRAAILGDAFAINKLLDSGRVHVDCRDNDGTTPLMFAVACCNYTCVQELLEQGADPNSRRYESGASPLFLAAQNGDIDTLRLLLKYGAMLDQPNFDGGTPLIVACQEGHELVVRELLNLGAEPNRGMKDRATPLFVCAQNGHLLIAKILMEKGAIVDPRRSDGATPLWIAAQMGWSHVCSTLLQHGAFVDALRNDGASPLFKAAHKGFKDVVRVLLPHKPKLGLLPNGESAVHGASMFGHLEVIKVLLRAGADPKLLNTQGLSPLQVAVRCKQEAVAEFFQRLMTPKLISRAQIQLKLPAGKKEEKKV